MNDEKRKNEIISKLMTIRSSNKLKPHECEWLSQAINYIKGLYGEDEPDELFGMNKADWEEYFREAMKRAKEDQDKIIKEANE